jgi:hypothetical protein
MEITFTKSRLIGAAILLLFIAIFLAYQFGLFAYFTPATPAAGVNEYNAQPAMKALATIYSPSGDQAVWEQAACLNMTPDGCVLFKAYYAPAIWKSGVNGANTGFVEVRAELEDGSQVWQADTTINGAPQPLFIHVQKREDGQWVLVRILFEEEAKKYEK